MEMTRNRERWKGFLEACKSPKSLPSIEKKCLYYYGLQINSKFTGKIYIRPVLNPIWLTHGSLLFAILTYIIERVYITARCISLLLLNSLFIFRLYKMYVAIIVICLQITYLSVVPIEILYNFGYSCL